MKVGFFVFLVLLVVDLAEMLGRKCGGAICKVNEHSSIPVDLPKLCGDNIMQYYTVICMDTVWAKHRRRRGRYDLLRLNF